MVSFKTAALFLSFSSSSEVRLGLILPQIPLRPIMLSVLRHTSLIPYSPCIMDETVSAVFAPLSTAFTIIDTVEAMA